MSKRFGFALLLASSLVLTACQDKEDLSLKLRELENENAVLRESAVARDQQIEEFANTINDIEMALNNIQEREEELRNLKTVASTAAQKDKVKAAIENIDSLMLQNSKRLNQLEKSLGKGQKAIAPAFEKIVERLKEDLSDRQESMTKLRSENIVLKEKINALQSRVERRDQELNKTKNELQSKFREIEEREDNYNTGFFLIGNRAELIDDGILTKTGGVFGFGKGTRLSERLDKTKFRQINTKNITNIDIGESIDVNLRTPHPTESYTFVETEGRVTLKVLDVSKFWSQSKFLVVETVTK